MGHYANQCRSNPTQIANLLTESQHIQEDEPIVMTLKHSVHHTSPETRKAQQQKNTTDTQNTPKNEFTLHLINDASWFYEVQDCKVTIHTAKPQHHIVATERGKLHLSLQNQNVLHIGDVHYSPKVINVLSVSRLLSKGFTIQFSKANAQIYTPKQVLLCHAHQSHGLL